MATKEQVSNYAQVWTYDDILQNEPLNKTHVKNSHVQESQDALFWLILVTKEEQRFSSMCNSIIADS